jgi:hypothetical protein
MTALRCVAELDAGPVYIKMPMSLLGAAEEILLRAARLTEVMIARVVQERPVPQPQSGAVTTFRRRTQQHSDVASLDSLEKLFGHIRMLDATGYPPAFLECGPFRFEFSRARLKPDSVIADVKLHALDAYAPEMRAFPHTRSIEAGEHLARWRGAAGRPKRSCVDALSFDAYSTEVQMRIGTKEICTTQGAFRDCRNVGQSPSVP